MNTNPLLLIAFTAFFASFALASSGQQNLDYCEVGQACTIGDFVKYDNHSRVTTACCNASVFQLNGTSIINQTLIVPNAYGFINATFVLNATAYYPVEIACNCSNEYRPHSFNLLVSNSSEININLSGINVSAAALTPEQNQTLMNIKAQTQCFMAGHAAELQGNISADPNSTLSNFLILITLLASGIALTAYGIKNKIPAMAVAGGIILMFAGLFILVNGVQLVTQHNRAYSCEYGTNATTGETTLINATITNTTSYTNGTQELILNGLGLVLTVIGVAVLAFQAVEFTRKPNDED